MSGSLRNFWADISVDGRDTDIGTGPRTKEGGMRIDLLQRDDGSKKKTFSIECREQDGVLTTTVFKDGVSIDTIKTQR
jgi:hypothetical protein